jgi:hypothetical protein
VLVVRHLRCAFYRHTDVSSSVVRERSSKNLTTPTSSISFKFCFSGETIKAYKLTMTVISDSFMCIISIAYIVAYVVFALYNFCSVIGVVIVKIQTNTIPTELS